MVYDLISVIILLFLGGTPEPVSFMSSKMHLLTSYLRRYMHLRIHTHTLHTEPYRSFAEPAID